ncbi:MAG: glycoside hydrolase family 1 protein [Candidatus Omnitrophica bacterium]|nr:glycoside hydrolase family 1 protein [Candidatus Omnitrophota bacterium]
MKRIEFPKGFLWGTATSAHQVEGNNRHNDWWEWEKSRNGDRSGEACAHYDLFEEDFTLAQSLHTNAHRLSIEWSRIEPEKDRWDEREIEHYRRAIDSLRSKGIEPIVTLHHFTNPLWIARSGGWESGETAVQFADFAGKVASEFAGAARWWVTINEPMVFIDAGYRRGHWPPQVEDDARATKVMRCLIRGHRMAYKAIHEATAARHGREVSVGVAKNFLYFVPCRPRCLKDRWAAWLRHFQYNRLFLSAIAGGVHGCEALVGGKGLPLKKALDFIGLNYYIKDFVCGERLDLPWGTALAGRVCTWEHRQHIDGRERNSLGWLISPEGIGHALHTLKGYGLPILITENGICTTDDSQRERFIKEHLFHVAKAIQDGVNVVGYTYWSLLDNFEWHEGFEPRFGLVEVDYATQKRTPRPSAAMYAQICRDNAFVYDGT